MKAENKQDFIDNWNDWASSIVVLASSLGNMALSQEIAQTKKRLENLIDRVANEVYDVNQSVAIPSGEYMSKKQAAEYLNISKDTLQYCIRNNSVKTIKIEGMGHLISKEEVIKLGIKLKK